MEKTTTRPATAYSLFLVLFATVGHVAAAEKAHGRQPQLPEKHTLINYSFSGTQEAWILPQLRVYDREGFQVLDAGSGFSESEFVGQLRGTLSKPSRTGSDLRLSTELRNISSKAEAPDLPAADFTILKYWADWCFPCHAQTRALEKVLPEYGDLFVVLLSIDVSQIRETSTNKPPRQLKLEDILTEEELKRFHNPAIPRVERLHLLRDAIQR